MNRAAAGAALLVTAALAACGPQGAPERQGNGQATAEIQTVDELATLSHEHILRERVVVGSAPSLVARLRELREQLHLDGIIVEPNPGGMIPLDQMMKSLEILAREVAPALR